VVIAAVSRTRIAVLASGRGTTFATLVESAQRGDIRAEVVLLVVSRPGAPVTEVANALGIECVVLDEEVLGADAVDTELDALLLDRRVDFVVLAGYLRKVGPRTLRRFAGRIVNTRPAPLPEFGGKGMFGDHVHRAVLESGAASSAATVHLIDGEYDTGPVISMQAVPVLPGDDVETLRTRVQAVERTLLVSTVGELAMGLEAAARPKGSRTGE
jgi:phosphoribosylglycinamide formyltransferase 1